VLARDGLLPEPLARTDARGVPRNAVCVSAVAYSIFALIPFGGLLAGDVLLYTAALALEFAALLKLRHAEPDLRGAFRVPLPIPGLAVLAVLPIAVIVAAVALEIRSEDIGLPGVMAAAALAIAGPVWYRLVPPRWAADAARG
jgi:APA family basic amino acid/polyamine antiporter